MSRTNTKINRPRIITIGNADGDSELLEKIYQYQKEKNIAYGADAVRLLCKFALDYKDVSKKI